MPSGYLFLKNGTEILFSIVLFMCDLKNLEDWAKIRHFRTA